MSLGPFRHRGPGTAPSVPRSLNRALGTANAARSVPGPPPTGSRMVHWGKAQVGDLGCTTQANIDIGEPLYGGDRLRLRLSSREKRAVVPGCHVKQLGKPTNANTGTARLALAA